MLLIPDSHVVFRASLLPLSFLNFCQDRCAVDYFIYRRYGCYDGICDGIKITVEWPDGMYDDTTVEIL